MKVFLWLLCFFSLTPIYAQDATFEDFDFKEPEITMPDALKPQAPTPEQSQPMLITAEAIQTMLHAQKDQKYEQWASIVREQSNNQLKIIIILCVVSLISLISMLYILRNRDSKDIVNAIGLNLIIFGTVIMVMIAETDQQLTAGAGILGAISGYLFRSIQNEGTSSSEPRPPNP